MVGWMWDLTGVVKAEADVHQFLLQRHGLFHDHVFNRLTGGPVNRLSAYAGPGPRNLLIQKFGGLTFPVATLNGIPAPGLSIPVRTVRPAIPRLLDESSAIEVVDQIVFIGRSADPCDRSAGFSEQPDFEVWIAQPDPVFRRGFWGIGCWLLWILRGQGIQQQRQQHQNGEPEHEQTAWKGVHRGVSTSRPTHGLRT